MREAGHVYVLTNAAMPGLVKIGRTRGSVAARVARLNSTGVPQPFRVYCSARVADCAAVERALHRRFARWRENPRREFFRVEAWRVGEVLWGVRGGGFAGEWRVGWEGTDL